MAKITLVDQIRETLQPNMSTGLQNLANTKLNNLTQRHSITNRLMDMQQTPAQQTLQSLFNPQSIINPQTQNLLQALQQFQPEQISQEPTKIANPATEIKEGKAIALTPAEMKREKAQELAQRKQDIILERERAKNDRIEQTALRKEKKPYIDKLQSGYEVANEGGLVLDKMEKLIDKGGLPIAAFYSLFDKLEHVSPAVAGPLGAAAGTYIGGPVGALIGGGIGALVSPVATMLKYAQRLTSPNTEEFEKLSSSFVKQAKSIFGSRITDKDLEAFMKTIPTLAQTDKGKRAIIDNMRVFNKAAQIKYKAYKDIIKENNNKIPEDLEFQVEERSKPELDKISEKFLV